MGPAQAANTTASLSSSFAQLLAAISTTSSPKNPPANMSTITSPLPTTTPTIIEKLPANIPCLEPNGSNWAIFKMRFSNAIKMMCQWAYFIRLSLYPNPIDPAKPTSEEAAQIVQWEFEDSIASYLLSQRLSDTTEMHLANCTTTKEHWDLVTKEYQAKSTYVQANLHQAFLKMCDALCSSPSHVTVGNHVTFQPLEWHVTVGTST